MGRGFSRSRKAVRSIPSGKRLKRLLIVAFSFSVVGMGWFWLQPPVTRGEVCRSIGAWIRHTDNVRFMEMVSDILTVNDANAAVVDYVPNDDEALGGMPSSKQTLVQLKNSSFFVGYDEEMRLPAWVAYKLFDGKEYKVGARPEAFTADERLDKPVKSSDYTGSGYDRGHLAPNSAIARCYGPDAQLETFRLSNIVPQKHEFNAGIWKSLEMREMNNYALRYGTVWIIAGPVYGNKLHYTQSGLPIPDKLFKIIACHRGNKIYTMAFLMDQKADGKFRKYLCSIDEIEQLTGLDFMPKLTTEQQNIIESKPASKVW